MQSVDTMPVRQHIASMIFSKRKICADCKEKKKLSEYYHSKNEKDKLAHFCKICSENRKLTWRKFYETELQKYQNKKRGAVIPLWQKKLFKTQHRGIKNQ